MTGKRYAIFSACFLPHLGGVERFTFNAAAELVRRGNSVVVITSNTEHAPSYELFREGFEVIRLPCIPLLNGRLPIPFYTQEYRRLDRHISSMSFDGVLVNTRFYFHSLYGMKVARQHGLTPVVLDHGSGYLSFSNAILDYLVRRYEDCITTFGLRHFAPHYFGISEKSSAWLSHFGISSRGVINNSIDADSYQSESSNRDFRTELGIGSSTFLVTFIGRLIPEKGIAAILEAAKSPLFDGRNIKFAIAGDGPLRQIVDTACDNVTYLGRLNQQDIASLLLQSDLNCLPSRSEGFATTLLEASSCSCPSIVTDVGGARELIPNDRYGTILSDASATSIAEEICRLYDNPKLLDIQRRSCHELVKTCFSWDKTAQALESALSD